MFDKKGTLLEKGQEVKVPSPKSDGKDIWYFEFNGIVEDVLEDRGTAIVIDGDGDFFEVEADRLTVAE